MLVTFDLIAVDNFWSQIWNQVSFVLLYSNLSEIEGPFWSPPTHPDNKGFWGFKKGRSSLVFLKAPFSFLIHILNWKDCQVDPIGFAPLLPSGDKHFAYYITNERNDGVYYWRYNCHRCNKCKNLQFLQCNTEYCGTWKFHKFKLK